jgi:Holliday junction resolvase RusA-like endonuclease
MGRRVTFTVDGPPVRWQRPKQVLTKTGVVRRFNDPAAERGKKVIATAAREAWGDEPPLTGPCLLRVVAIFAIPPSWPAKLKQAARESRVFHIADPDLSQLVKLPEDALVGIAYEDDNQVVGYPNSAKRYGYPERTEITVEALAQAPDEVTPGQARLEKTKRPVLSLRFPTKSGAAK